MKTDLYFGLLYLIGFFIVANSGIMVIDYFDRRNNPVIEEVKVLSVVEKKAGCCSDEYQVLVEKMDGDKVEFSVSSSVGTYLLEKNLPCVEKLEISKDGTLPFGVKLFISSVISIIFFIVLGCNAENFNFKIDEVLFTTQLPVLGCILSGIILISPLIF